MTEFSEIDLEIIAANPLDLRLLGSPLGDFESASIQGNLSSCLRRTAAWMTPDP